MTVQPSTSSYKLWNEPCAAGQDTDPARAVVHMRQWMHVNGCTEWVCGVPPGRWRTGRDAGGSVRIGLRVLPRPGQEVEVAALIRLGDVLLVERAVAALEPGLRAAPPGPAPGQFRVVHVEGQGSGGHV